MKKKILGTSDPWLTSRLSHRPSVLYCRLTDFMIPKQKTEFDILYPKVKARAVLPPYFLKNHHFSKEICSYFINETTVS